MPVVYEYIDYRKFLADDLGERKTKNPRYSYHAWGAKIGMTAGTLTRIISGTRNISPTCALRLAQYCKLTKKETEYFQLLVDFNQAKSPEEKATYVERMRAYKHSSLRKVHTDQYEFYSKWYHTVIRELLHLRPFAGDYKQLSQMVVPHLSIAEAKASLELLDRLGFIRKDAQGNYFPADTLISTGFDAYGTAVHAFQRQMLDLAGQAYDRFAKEDRSFSTMTLSISEQDYRTIVDELRAFRRRALEIATNSTTQGRVYQFNFQVFPVSEPIQ